MSNMRVKSAVHAIAILVSLKNKKIKNDFKLMFTFLCISFGDVVLLACSITLV